jgi:ribosome-associated protein
VTEKAQRTESSRSPRLEAARAFAVDAARLAAATRCHNVVTLDVTDLSPVTDFFVIASGTSARQMRTVIDEIEEMGEGHGYRPMSRSGYEGESWIVLDFVDVIVHVFNDEARHFYDLENLWGDAKRVEWQTAEAANASALGHGAEQGVRPA